MFKQLITTTGVGLVIAFAGPAAAQSSGSYRQQPNEYDAQSRQSLSAFGGQRGQQRSYEPQQQDGQRRQAQRSRAELSLDTEHALLAHGYDVGPVDGNIDAKSRAGIRAYQRDAGLETNGQTSPQLLAHIEGNNIKAGAARPMDSVGSAAGQAVDQFLKRNR
jgi:hypothetical protein